MKNQTFDEINKPFFVLYSPSQDAFHVDSYRKMIETNHHIVAQGLKSDYLVMGMYDTWDEAQEAGIKMRTKLTTNTDTDD